MNFEIGLLTLLPFALLQMRAHRHDPKRVLKSMNSRRWNTLTV